MANTVNFDALTEYINNHRDELFVKAAATAKTLDYIETMYNVKFKEELNYIDSQVILQDGSSCAWNPQGSDTFGVRTIEVKPLTVNKEFCSKDMRKFWMNYLLAFEAGRETLPFEEKIAEANLNAIKNALEVEIWQGGQTDGLLKLIKADADATKVTRADGTSASAAIEGVYKALSSQMLAKGVNIFVAPEIFTSYVLEMNESCCANKPIVDAAAGELVYLSDSRVKIVSLPGLAGSTDIVAATADALVYGTDIEGSEGVYKMIFDEKEDKFLFKVLFNAGEAVKLPWEVVYSVIG